LEQRRKTTNLLFSEWTQVFPNARLCKALLDRITDRAHIHRDGHGELTLQANGGGEKESQRIVQRRMIGMPLENLHVRFARQQKLNNLQERASA
jgi:hypothetical protein